MNNSKREKTEMNNKNTQKTPNWMNLGIKGPAGALGVNQIPENPYNTPVILQGYNPTGTSRFKNPYYGVFSGSQSLGGRANTEENYEDSDISTKDRTIDSFVEWIKLKSGENNITKSETTESESHHESEITPNKKTKKHRTGGSKTKRRGGKWSAKYKRSINCRRPKGFSQRQYCKYSRKK
jgi:hypothetical protein